MDKIRVLSLFSGIGAFEKALGNIGVDYELINYCEIDEYASKSYSAIHEVDESLNLWDITEVSEESIDDFDLLVGGTPCQNISRSGNNKGLKGEQSKLFYEFSRILNYKMPKYFVFENVDSLLTSNKGEDWKAVKDELSLNYNITHMTLNSKFYDIPQDRNRVFIVGIKIGVDEHFEFKGSNSLTKKCIEDILEESVAEKLYIEKTNGRYDEIIEGYDKSDKQNREITRIGNIYPKNGQNGNIYSIKGLSPTLRSGQGIVGSGIGSNNAPKILTNDKRIRRTTPLENWRIMGFKDEDFDKAKKSGVSDTQLYKQSGNSIVVQVLEDIFRELLL